MFASGEDLLKVEGIGKQNIYAVLQFIAYKIDKEDRIRRAQEKAVG